MAEPTYSWKRSDTDPDYWLLFAGPIQVGAHSQSKGQYFPLLPNGTWGEPCQPSQYAPPVPVPPAVSKREAKKSCKCCGEECDCAFKPCGKPGCNCVVPGAVIEKDGTLNFGLTRPTAKQSPKSVHNGREVTKSQLMEVLQKASVPNDAGELCLTVIGPEAERNRVLADLAASPVLAPWKGKLKIQGYPPDHWAVKDSGFVTTGKPTIYCQAPDGKVLHRQDSYVGPEPLAEALRGVDPSYSPGRDPNINNPLPSLDGFAKWLESVPGWVWVALAFLLYLRLGHKE